MLTCSMHFCNSNQHTTCNNEKIRFFCLPTYQELLQKHGTQGQKQRDATTINNNQRKAWLHALKLSEREMQSKCKHHHNICVCCKHFHPSVLEINLNNQTNLQLGACPTMHMSTFSVDNDVYKENKALPRSAATPDEKDRLSKSAPLQNIESALNSSNMKDNIYACKLRQI